MKQTTVLEMIVDGNRYKVAVSAKNTVHIWDATNRRAITTNSLYADEALIYALEILLTANGFIVYEDGKIIKATREVKNL